MLRIIAYVFWFVVVAVLVTVGLANRDVVTLRAVPEALAGLVGGAPTVQLPLFLVIFLAVAVGLLIGFVWEWLREAPLRAEARDKSRAVDDMRREMGRMQARSAKEGDDIIALLDAPKR